MSYNVNRSSPCKVGISNTFTIKSHHCAKENEFTHHFKQFSTSFNYEADFEKHFPVQWTSLKNARNKGAIKDSFYTGVKSIKEMQQQQDNDFINIKLKKTGIKLVEDDDNEERDTIVCSLASEVNNSWMNRSGGHVKDTCTNMIEISRLNRGRSLDAALRKDKPLQYKKTSCSNSNTVELFGHRTPMHSYRPNRPSNPNKTNPSVNTRGAALSNNRFVLPSKQQDELTKTLKPFAKDADKTESLLRPSQISPRKKSTGNSKDVNRNFEKKIKPVVPIPTDLKSITLKKTGVNLLDDISDKNNKEVENEPSSDLLDKPVGKIDKSKFEQTAFPSQKPTINAKPALLRKPAVRNERNDIPSSANSNIKPIPSPNIKPKPLSQKPVENKFPFPQSTVDNKFNPPTIQPKFKTVLPPKQSEPEFPLPPPELMSDEIYDDVATTEVDNTQMDEIYDDVAATEENVGTSQQINDSYSEEVYDDVDTSEMSTFSTPNDQNILIQEEEEDDGEAIYDTVENSVITEMINNNNNIGSDEIYDDVAEIQPAQSLSYPHVEQPEPVADEIYDDVDPTAEQQNDTPKQVQTYPLPPNTNKLTKHASNVYLAPSDEILTPVKPPKTFGEVEQYRFAIPHGLTTWLQQIIVTNLSKLQSNGMSSAFFDAYINGLNGGPGIKKINDDYDKDSIKSTDSKQEKENKKEKKKQKQLEKERKAREQKMKKQMEKDMKSFNIDPKQELVVLGNVSASSETKGSKKDLPYQHGDEISLLQTTHDCPAGRMIAQNMTTMRVGYIVKADFNLSESSFPEPRGRIRSLIPTEDEEGLYEESDGGGDPFPTHQIAPRPSGAPPPPVPQVPPPLPQTPRPCMNSSMPVPVPAAPILIEEEIYDDIVDVSKPPPPQPVEEEIYEEI